MIKKMDQNSPAHRPQDARPGRPGKLLAAFQQGGQALPAPRDTSGTPCMFPRPLRVPSGAGAAGSAWAAEHSRDSGAEGGRTDPRLCCSKARASEREAQGVPDTGIGGPKPPWVPGDVQVM